MDFNVNFKKNNKLNLQSKDLTIKSKITVGGENNLVEIDEGVSGTVLIEVSGVNNYIKLAPDIKVNGVLRIYISGCGSQITIGKDCTFQGLSRVFVHETSSILIGNDCMFSDNIFITSSDMHPIHDDSGDRINKASSIKIGDHVWLCMDARILKGVNLGKGSIVGLGAIVTSGTYQDRIILAGNPAKIVKTGISWSRK